MSPVRPRSPAPKAPSALHFSSSQVEPLDNLTSVPDLNEARYPSGKGEVCKTFMRRFDPDPRLQKILLKTKDLIETAVVRVKNVSTTLVTPLVESEAHDRHRPHHDLRQAFGRLQVVPTESDGYGH